MKLLKFLSEFGNHRFSNEEDIKLSRFHNRGLTIGFFAVAITMFITIYLFAMVLIKQIPFNSELLKTYAIAYFGIEISIFLITLLFFYLKYRLKSNLIVYYAYIPFHLVYIFTLSLFLGETANIHLLMLNFLPLVIFVPVKLRFHKFLFFIFYLTIVIFSFILIKGHTAYFPIPEYLNHIVATMVEIFVTVYIILFFIFSW